MRGWILVAVAVMLPTLAGCMCCHRAAGGPSARMGRYEYRGQHEMMGRDGMVRHMCDDPGCLMGAHENRIAELQDRVDDLEKRVTALDGGKPMAPAGEMKPGTEASPMPPMPPMPPLPPMPEPMPPPAAPK